MICSNYAANSAKKSLGMPAFADLCATPLGQWIKANTKNTPRCVEGPSPPLADLASLYEQPLIIRSTSFQAHSTLSKNINRASKQHSKLAIE